MAEELEERFIKPIVNASYPATLAALSLTILTITGITETPASLPLKVSLLVSGAAFLLSAFAIFFYGIYPTRRSLWTVTALAFLIGLFSLIFAVFLLFLL